MYVDNQKDGSNQLYLAQNIKSDTKTKSTVNEKTCEDIKIYISTIVA